MGNWNPQQNNYQPESNNLFQQLFEAGIPAPRNVKDAIDIIVQSFKNTTLGAPTYRIGVDKPAGVNTLTDPLFSEGNVAGFIIVDNMTIQWIDERNGITFQGGVFTFPYQLTNQTITVFITKPTA